MVKSRFGEDNISSSCSRNYLPFYGTRRFITAFTSARQLDPVHTPKSHFLKIYINIILPSTPASPKWSLSFRFPHQNPVHALLPPYVLHAPPISFFLAWTPEKYCVRSRDLEAPQYVFFSTPLLPHPS